MSKLSVSATRCASPRLPAHKLATVGLACALVATTSAVVAPRSDARVTAINITTRETPTYGGYSFPGVGQYEKIVGTMTAEISPTDAHNLGIVDLSLAPRLPDGNVQYSFTFYILKPINLAQGNHKIFYRRPIAVTS
jgi:hypothetical protein